MNRRRALVVVPVLLLCVAGLWLLARGEKEDGRPAGPTTAAVTEAGPTTARPGPTLAPPAPPTEAPPATESPAPGAATEAGPDATSGTASAMPPSPGVRLRGVRGRVVSAADGKPIAGAFVSWGAPPAKVLDAIRSSPALLEAGEGGEITDAGGRFDLPRVDDDRPRGELFASAAGWLQASTVVGLREEVELRLARSGRLAVRMANDPGPLSGEAGGPPGGAVTQSDLRRLVGVVAEGPGGVRHAYAWREWPPVLEVAPGTWRVQVDGAASVEGTVVAGETTTIEVAAPVAVQVEGKVVGAERPPGAPPAVDEGPTLLELIRVGELGSTAPARARSEYTFWLGEAGTFAGTLPPGVYTARVHLRVPARSGEGSDESERVVTAPVRIAPPGPEQLELALAPAPAVEVRVTATGVVETPSALGLVGADGDPPELVALTRSPDEGGASPGTLRYVGGAPPGRWSVFLGPTYAGEVDLAEGTPAALTLRPFDVTIRWRVPEALRDGEVLRGALAVVPAELARRPIGARFREDAALPFDASRGGEPYRLQLLAPGRYLLCGSTELGPFEREVELTGPTEVEVELTAR